ncbi:MAG: 2-amino-4-hydroxy-6-hydroxymethyldihydropteridine diphosphokinase [Deltaproteobacteria bacterium]|jgi:2-amino-4-hydroxy-6-hydroxymethyldihydropteridine diphosphokinase|nr:2-amino-4-hydroxy-6-hydroxymethyldihydropteridine diphosphokinase [Deltaproteobacteria bacterium]
METSREIISFVGIGSNRESPADRCREAIRRIAEIGGVNVLRRSSLYRTEPVGFSDQEWFINAVVEIRTILPAHELLACLRHVEDDMGRLRGTKWGPRVIDLDILFYGQEVIREEDMVIPHPELHKRRFVLVPLNEIASWMIHPAFGVSVGGLMDRLEDGSTVELHTA